MLARRGPYLRPHVDSLYCDVLNMKGLAVRLDELGLRDVVRDIRSRVERAVADFTDEAGQPVVEQPGVLTCVLAPRALHSTGRIPA